MQIELLHNNTRSSHRYSICVVIVVLFRGLANSIELQCSNHYNKSQRAKKGLFPGVKKLVLYDIPYK